MENVTSLSLFGVSQAAGSGARIKNRAGFAAPIPEGKGREGLWRGPGSLPEASELVVEPGSEPRTVPPLPTTARRTAECKRGRAEPWRKGLHREGPGGKRWQGQNVGRPWGALCQFLGCPLLQSVPGLCGQKLRLVRCCSQRPVSLWALGGMAARSPLELSDFHLDCL